MKMLFQLPYQSSALFIVVFILFKLPTMLVEGQPHFTQEPPSKLFVETGKNATFDWKYFVSDRQSKFELFSPKWSFYDENGTEHVIGSDLKLENWNFKIDSSNCPKRLLTPTRRVFREENATLVITNVITADNGMYGCTLVLNPPPPKESNKVQLIVTVTPQITLNETKHVILEHDNLTVTCSANGPPTPNVIWTRNGNNITSGVNGIAVLRIYNITRHQSGKYNCSANNNPNEMSVVKEIDVIVEYPVECNETLSDRLVKAYPEERNVKLKTVADGVPVPKHVWYSPKKTMVHSERSKESTYTITKVAKEHFGNWTINITNTIHSSYCLLRIEVIKVEGPLDPDVEGLSAGEIVGIVIGVLAGIGIIAVIAVVIYKKKKKSG